MRVKFSMFCYIDTTRGGMEAPVVRVKGAVTQVNTREAAVGEFVGIVRSKEREHGTAKRLEFEIVRRRMEELMVGRLVLQHSRRMNID
jgi:hypothetical protein